MSGTSLDGISCAIVRFSSGPSGQLRAELLGFTTREYSSQQREMLARALVGDTPAGYCKLNFDLGDWFADAVVATIAESGVGRADITAVASHGQTIWHEPGHPNHPNHTGSTWQIGESAVIAERTGINVISDFRVRDVAAGGQGAPLVPIADALLFASRDHWRALQNLGGMGNITVVPPGGDLSAVRAFDTGPGVVIIDGVTRLLRPDLKYDIDGKLALAGNPIESVVNERLKHPFFAAEPPKSTGRELFNAGYIQSFVDDCRAAGAQRDEDIIATAVELTARSIALAFQKFIPEPVKELVLSGGGAKNPALTQSIRKAFAESNYMDKGSERLCDSATSVSRAEPFKPLSSASEPVVLNFDDLYFDSEAKEAVAFALLGYLYTMNQPGNVPSATGAHGPRILGKFTPANPPEAALSVKSDTA